MGSLFTQIITLSLRNFGLLAADLIEPVLSVPVKGILYLINAFFGGRINLPYSYYVPIAWIIICAGIFLIGKLLLCVGFTKSIAMVIYSRAEILLAFVMVVIGSVKNTMEVAFTVSENKDLIIASVGADKYDSFRIFIIAASCIVVSALAITTWYFISSTVYAALSYQQNFLPYPFTSFFTEMIRLFVYIVFLVIGLTFSQYAHLFFLFCVIVTIVVYPKSRKMLDYFYFQDILTFRYLIIDNILKKKEHTGQHYVPYSLRKKYPFVSFMVAFVINKDRIPELPIELYDKVYLGLLDGKLTGFYKQKRKWTAYAFEDYKELFFVEGHENFAIFTLDGPKEEITHLFKRPKRDLCAYVSKANTVPFLELTKSLQVIDYSAYERELKERRFTNGNNQTL